MFQTLTGWILFEAISASAMGTVGTAIKLGMVLRGRAALDRRDIHAAYAFGVLLAFSTLLFLVVGGAVIRRHAHRDPCAAPPSSA